MTAAPQTLTKRYKEPEKAADLGTETESATDQQLCYHVLGTPQSSDRVVWAMPETPTWMSSAEVSDDGGSLLLYVSEGCQPKNRWGLMCVCRRCFRI
jgi:prolyl oligopeptidase